MTLYLWPHRLNILSSACFFVTETKHDLFSPYLYFEMLADAADFIKS